MEMWDIELEARRRAAAPPAPTRRDPAGPGCPAASATTPGFRYRDHLEAVIAHGAPPTSLLRRLLD